MSKITNQQLKERGQKMGDVIMALLHQAFINKTGRKPGDNDVDVYTDDNPTKDQIKGESVYTYPYICFHEGENFLDIKMVYFPDSGATGLLVVTEYLTSQESDAIVRHYLGPVRNEA